MKSIFEYKGYYGSAEVDTEDGQLHGKLLWIPDAVVYEGSSVPELKQMFEEAVDSYLADCNAAGDEPSLPCKGSFNVRISPAKHREAAIYALQNDCTLNEFVCQAIDEKLAAISIPLHYQIALYQTDHLTIAAGIPPKWTSLTGGGHYDS